MAWSAAAALVVLVLLGFSPAFSAGYVSWDDLDNLVKNTHYRGLSLENLRWMATAFHMGHYHPLTWLSFALDYSLWGTDPQGYHVTSVLIHAANAVLFFLLSRRLLHTGLGGDDPARQSPRADLTITAAFAAALWAIHPLRVESVAWLTERRDVLSTLFMLASAYAYVSAVEPGSPRLRSQRSYWLAVALLALSCLSKAWGMSFFVVLLALDVYPLRRLPVNPLRWFTRDGLKVVAEKAPMIALGLLTAFLAAKAQQAIGATKTLEQWPLASRAVQSAYGLWFYVEKSFAPTNLSPLYQLPAHVNAAAPRFLAAFAFVAVAIVSVAIACIRRPKAAAVPVAAAIYLVMLAPVLGFVQSGEQFVADRYSYLATMPLALLVAAAGLWLYRRAKSLQDQPRAAPLLLTVGGIVIASLAALTYSQTTIWHDSLSLWSYAASTTPGPFAHDYLGDELSREGKTDKALEQYQLAVAFDPSDGRAWFCIANILKDTGQHVQAEHAYLEAARFLAASYQAHQNLGYLYLNQGRKEDAIRQFELAIADIEDRSKGDRPLSGGPYMALGLARKDQGRTAEARSLFEKARQFPDTRDDAAKAMRDLGP